jgi:hypothetical protein
MRLQYGNQSGPHMTGIYKTMFDAWVMTAKESK